jgi:glutamine cyclotransferase
MKKMKKIFIILILALFCFFSAAPILTPLVFGAENTANKIGYKIVKTYPHDKNAFTQGFEFYNGYLYEGTGLYGRSSLRKIDLQTGRILKTINLDDKYFGEGITILNNKIYQLSWQNNTLFVYNLEFDLIKKVNYSGEGWGLTNDGKNLIMSNGSEYIYYRDPKTFKITKKTEIVFANEPLKNINELEYINGFIYANIWGEDIIVQISPKSSEVIAYLDLKNILDKSKYDYKINVLNGIAYLEDRDHLLITGKLWPKIFEIKITNSIKEK